MKNTAIGSHAGPVGSITTSNRVPSGAPANAAAYLRTTAFNLGRSRLRRRRRRPDPLGPVPVEQQAGQRPGALPAPDDQFVLRADQRQVLDAVRALPDRQRACVVLRFYQGLGPAQIASTLGISTNSVKTHLRRGMAALAEALEPLREEDR